MWIYDKYEHIRCDCGGELAKHLYNRISEDYACSICKKIYNRADIEPKADLFVPNTKTGWLFPMRKRGK